MQGCCASKLARTELGLTSLSSGSACVAEMVIRAGSSLAPAGVGPAPLPLLSVTQISALLVAEAATAAMAAARELSDMAGTDWADGEGAGGWASCGCGVEEKD